MTVMARIDPRAIHAEAARAHLEWLARDPDGEPIEHPAFPGIWLTCPFSTYYSEFVVEISREIVAEYGVDAIFANRWERARCRYQPVEQCVDPGVVDVVEPARAG